MANLYLTHKCKRGCPFCFARKVLKAADDVNEILTLEEIEKFLDHFKCEIRDIGLLGGEPFQYPRLIDVIELLKSRHIHAKIFTSATDPLPEGLEDFDNSCGHINFVVNVGDRSTYNDRQFANLEHFFSKFHMASALSYTIFDLEKDNPEFLFDMIDRYQLVRNIRTGIALPIYKGGNQYIDLDEYKRAGEYFCKCSEQAAKRHITMSMDCGFQACMFDDKQIGRLTRLGAGIGFMCGAALDIGPGLQAWNCFPLFQLGRVNALDAKNMAELKDMLNAKLEETLGSQPGVRRECAVCDLFRRQLCEGGCKSFKSVNS
jgi:organic radical activating enzyme